MPDAVLLIHGVDTPKNTMCTRAVGLFGRALRTMPCFIAIFPV